MRNLLQGDDGSCPQGLRNLGCPIFIIPEERKKVFLEPNI
jgi:hypothetical protein